MNAQADAQAVFEAIGGQVRFCPHEGSEPGGFWFERDYNGRWVRLYGGAFSVSEIVGQALGDGHPSLAGRRDLEYVGPSMAAVTALSHDPRVRGPVLPRHVAPGLVLTDAEMGIEAEAI